MTLDAKMPHAHAASIALGPVGGTPRLAAAGPGVAYTCAESETKTSTRWPLSHMCRSVLRLAVLDMLAGLVPRALPHAAVLLRCFPAARPADTRRHHSLDAL